MERKTMYFEKQTPENTEAVFRLVRERPAGSGISKLVLASTIG